jgi:putative Mg2+ transporter-C (MgtC) family protein
MDPTLHFLWKLALAGALGAAVGLERQFRRRPAGMRTSMFICMGACLFTILSGAIARIWGDTGSTRIASNIVQGIGFLGAGAILRERGTVIGLTTASVIFVLAAVGMGVGGGFYALSSLAVLLMLFALVVFGWIEDMFGLKTRLLVFRFHADSLESATKRLHESLDHLKVQMQRFQVLHIGNAFSIEFEADVSSAQARALVSSLSDEHERCEVVARDEGGTP